MVFVIITMIARYNGSCITDRKSPNSIHFVTLNFLSYGNYQLYNFPPFSMKEVINQLSL